MKKQNKILISIISFIIFLTLAKPSLAVDLFLFSANKEIATDQVVVTLGLNTGSDKINAVSGELSYDVSKLELVAVSNANSIVSLWLENPTEKTAGVVSFSGIVPGGFGGTGRLISLIFETKNGSKDVASLVSVKRVEVLRNDSSGQAVITKIITPPQSLISALTANLPATIDQLPPDSFVPLLSKNDQLLGGQSYLIFNTTDKGSGIVKYFVAESSRHFNSSDKVAFDWQEATSPYLLQDQTLQSYVYVKAVDRAGNELVVELPRGKRLYQLWWFWVIIISGILLVVWRWRNSF